MIRQKTEGSLSLLVSLQRPTREAGGRAGLFSCSVLPARLLPRFWQQALLLAPTDPPTNSCSVSQSVSLSTYILCLSFIMFPLAWKLELSNSPSSYCVRSSCLLSRLGSFFSSILRIQILALKWTVLYKQEQNNVFIYMYLNSDQINANC